MTGKKDKKMPYEYKNWILIQSNHNEWEVNNLSSFKRWHLTAFGGNPVTAWGGNALC